MKPSALLLPILAFATQTVSHAQEWARFRGPNGTGISHAKTIPTQWTDRDINWKVELPGTGHSSPVVWGDRVFLTSTGDQAGGLHVLCVSTRDGSVLWRHNFPLTPFSRHKFNSYASATPAVDAERVYVVWNQPDHYFLTALDHDGHPIWQRDFGSYLSQHGCGSSPVPYEGKVILGNEQDDKSQDPNDTRRGKSFILAVAATTGKTLWQTPRNSAVVAYSTPCIYQPKNGQPQFIFNSQAHGIYGVEPNTGKVLWEYSKAFDKRSVSSPVVAGDLIYGSCGSGGGGNFVTAVHPGEAANSKPATLAYQLKKSAPYVPTGVNVGNLVWFWSDGGIVTCLHAPSGEIRYQERVGGNFFGSPVWVDERLFCISSAGEVVVVQASDKFKLLARFPLDELTQTTPAISGGRMYIRTTKHLLSIGGGPGATAAR